MYTSFNVRLGKDVTFIHPGEYFSSYDDIIISTLLGSCISVVLFDPVNKVGGMNHFMLPSTTSKEFYLTESGKYGMFAMELLINSMMKNGAERKNLEAKVFGGASVMHDFGKSYINVSQSNINFAFEYLNVESIKIISSDVGGVVGRKIFLYPKTGMVLLKRLSGQSIIKLTDEEYQYLRSVRKQYD